MASRTPPGHDGGVLLEPSWSDWPALLARTRELVASWPTGMVTMRADARRELVPDADLEGSWVVTGHQPIVVHPGIWFRYLLLDHLVRMGSVGLELVVDTDEATAVTIRLPSLEPVPATVSIELARGSAGLLYDRLEVAGDLAAIRRRGLDALRGSSEHLADRFNQFLRALGDALATDRSVAAALPAVRRNLEGAAHHATLTISRVARTRVHRRFVAEVIDRAPQFAAAVNRELARYRLVHGIDNHAQPMPDLRVEGDRFELPFWSVRDGRRYRAWRDGETLRDESGAASPLKGEPDDGWTMVPRALALTLFQRLCVADLFIHGLGSARYDAVSEGVAAEMWGLALPATAIATTSRLFALPPDAEADAAQQWLALARSHPERVVGPDGARLAVEKARLIADRASRPTEQVRRRLDDVQRELRRMLDPLVPAWRAASARQHARAALARDRELAYFLWSADDMKARLL